MRILVCVKQVPATQEVKLNKETNTIIREGVESEINPFDAFALEEAIRIKEKYGEKVFVMSMGIPSVSEILKKSIAMGGDEAILLSDRKFAGADTNATAYSLAKGIEKVGDIDIIICGKQAVDGDTAQVGPSIAEKLGIPHTTCVRKIEKIENGYIQCQRALDDGYEVIQMKLPALITVTKEINIPRIPSLKGLMRAKKEKIICWGIDDINADECLCGLNGSPTKVVKTFASNHYNEAEMIQGDAKVQAKMLVEKLRSLQLPGLI